MLDTVYFDIFISWSEVGELNSQGHHVSEEIKVLKHLKYIVFPYKILVPNIIITFFLSVLQLVFRMNFRFQLKDVL